MYVRHTSSLGAAASRPWWDPDIASWLTGGRVTEKSIEAEKRDFLDPNVSWSEWWRANYWGQPEADHSRVGYRPPGPIVPEGALSGNYTPYSAQYGWCQKTDADCLNRAAAAEVQEKRDAKRNVENIASGIMDAASRSLDPPTSQEDENYTPYLVAAGAVVLALMLKR